MNKRQEQKDTYQSESVKAFQKMGSKALHNKLEQGKQELAQVFQAFPESIHASYYSQPENATDKEQQQQYVPQKQQEPER